MTAFGQKKRTFNAYVKPNCSAWLEHGKLFLPCCSNVISA